MQAARKATLVALALCSTVVLVLLIPRVRCGSLDTSTASTNNAAKQWLHFWPDKFDWDVRIENSRWKPMVSTRIAAAESALTTVSWIPLTDAQALDFTGESGPPDATTAHPYLVRCVVAAAAKDGRFRVDISARSRNSDIWIASGAIGHCPVPMMRQPIVAWLDNPPQEVFVTFGVAE